MGEWEGQEPRGRGMQETRWEGGGVVGEGHDRRLPLLPKLAAQRQLLELSVLSLLLPTSGK